MNEYIDKLYNLIDEIKKSEQYINLYNSYTKLINDKNIKPVLDRFIFLKNSYDKFDKEKTKELSLVKAELYKSKLYIEYENALKEYNNSFKFIEESINNTLFDEKFKTLLKMR